jgi:hypothetical protein
MQLKDIQLDFERHRSVAVVDSNIDSSFEPPEESYVYMQYLLDWNSVSTYNIYKNGFGVDTATLWGSKKNCVFEYIDDIIFYWLSQEICKLYSKESEISYSTESESSEPK